MAITAALVKELRQRSGAGMMDCKKALVETDGNVEEAYIYLQKKGIAKAGKKAGRTAAEGLVGTSVSDGGKTGVLIEVNCETDFVARNDGFKGFVADAVALAESTGAADIDALKAASKDGQSVEDWTKASIASIGENIQLRRLVRFEAPEGVIGAYVHAGSQIGVLVHVDVNGASDDDAAEFARNVAMHVAATNPDVLAPEDISEAEREQKREILTAQALDSGKPANIVEKMVTGRIRKWQSEVSLLKQPYVKEPDLSVEKYQKQVGGVTIKRFVRFQVGEGIEKAQGDLASEVAGILGQ